MSILPMSESPPQLGAEGGHTSEINCLSRSEDKPESHEEDMGCSPHGKGLRANETLSAKDQLTKTKSYALLNKPMFSKTSRKTARMG